MITVEKRMQQATPLRKKPKLMGFITVDKLLGFWNNGIYQ
jgi:hypothetical protein